MGTDRTRPVPRAARLVTLSLEALTVVGVGAGVVGFLSGTFAPLVDQLREAWPLVGGRALPTVALVGAVGVPQALALGLGLRRHPRAADAGVLVGVGLAGWVLLQLPLIGWTSPVQWIFAGVGVAEAVASAIWRGPTPDRPAGL